MIFEVRISDDIVDACRSEAENIGKRNNSIRHGAGNLIGVIGEELVCRYLGATRENTYNYDVIIGSSKIDVKTKETTVVPELDYFVSVPDFNTSQSCDYYYFVRVHKSMKWGWLLGGISKQEFYEKASFYYKGDIDPNSNGKWRFAADCYNLKISELYNTKLESLYK